MEKLTTEKADSLRSQGYSEDEILGTFYKTFVKPVEGQPFKDFMDFQTTARQKIGWAPPITANGPIKAPPEPMLLRAADAVQKYAGPPTRMAVATMNAPLTMGTGMGTGLEALSRGSGVGEALGESARVMGFKDLSQMESPVSQVAEIVLGSPRTRMDFNDTSAKRLVRGLVTFAGEMALPLSALDVMRKLKALPKVSEMVNLMKPVRATQTPPVMALENTPNVAVNILPEQATALNKSFEAATGIAEAVPPPATEKLSATLLRNLSEQSTQKMDIGLAKTAGEHSTPLWSKAQTTSTLRYPEKDLMIPLFRKAPADRVLRGTGLLETADIALRREASDLQEVKSFLAPVSKFLSKKGNESSRKLVTEALDRGTVNGVAPKEGEAIADLLSGETKDAYVAVRATFNELAARLGLPREKFVSNYLTHLFEKEYQILPDEIANAKGIRELQLKFMKAREGGTPPDIDVLESLEAYLPAAIRYINRQPAITLMNLKAQRLAQQPLRNSVAQWFINSFAGMPDPFPSGMKPGMLFRAGQAMNDAVDHSLAFISKKAQGLHVDWVPKEDGSAKWAVINKGGERLLWADTASEAAEMMDHLSKFRPGVGNRAASLLTGNVYRGTIAANVGSAFRNVHQILNTAVRAGVLPTIRGAASLFDPEARKVVKAVMGPGHVSRELVEGSLPKLLEAYDSVIFAPFNAAEFFNRGTSFWAGVHAASKAGKKNPDELIRAGMDVMNDTQFLYGVMGRSPMFSHPVTRPLGAFLSFPMKQSSWVSTVLREGTNAAKRGIKTGSLTAQESSELSAMARLMGITGIAAMAGTEYGKGVVGGIMGGFNGWDEVRSRLKKGVNPMGGVLKNSWTLMTGREDEKARAQQELVGLLKLFSGIPIKGVETIQKVWAIQGNEAPRFDVVDQAGNKLFTLSRDSAMKFAFGMPDDEVSKAFNGLRKSRLKRTKGMPTLTQQIVEPRFGLAPTYRAGQ